jgi:SAM-dependent methyltransferase
MFPLLSYFLFALAAFVAYFFLSGFIWGAGYYPTSSNEIDSVIRLLKLDENSTFYDLGSGYGRMIITIAQRTDAHSIGVEIDPIKCWWSRRQIRRKGLDRKVEVLHSNFLNIDLDRADAIFVFLSSEGSIMEKLYAKIRKECRPGTRIVSFEHKFKNWQPEKSEGKLHLYSLVPGTKE